jgi:hypothetical protein
MADTTVKISEETRSLLQGLAKARGTSMRALIDDLVREAENQQRLEKATAIYRSVLATPGLLEAFDERYGGPAIPQNTQQAA